MCGFTVNLIDFDRLTPAQKKALLKNYRKKKASLQAMIKDANRSLEGIEKALGVMQKKSKRSAKKA
jgi:hypothetical protein